MSDPPKSFTELYHAYDGESDRGFVLTVVQDLDNRLRQILEASMIETASKTLTKSLLDGTGPLATFSARISACFAFGLISALEKNDLDQLRRIRNECAHSSDRIDLNNERIGSYVAGFKYLAWLQVNTSVSNRVLIGVTVGALQGALVGRVRMIERPLAPSEFEVSDEDP